MYLGWMPLPRRSCQHLFQVVHPDAVVVDLHGDEVDVALAQEVERAGEAELLDDDRVALFQQDLVDNLDALPGAGGNQDFVNGDVDSAVRLELVNDELAERQDALRPVEAVHGHVLGIAAEDVGGCLDEPLHRHRVGVAVTADEVVPRVALPLRGGSGQVLVEERRIVEGVAGHGVVLPKYGCVPVGWQSGADGMVALWGGGCRMGGGCATK